MSSPSREGARAALVAIGDEVLRGEVANGNAAFLSERLFELGLDLGEQMVVSDDPTAIRAALVRLRPGLAVKVSVTAKTATGKTLAWSGHGKLDAGAIALTLDPSPSKGRRASANRVRFQRAIRGWAP